MSTRQPLDPDMRERLQARITAAGTRVAVAQAIGVAPGTLQRALLGAPLTLGVRTVLAQALGAERLA